MDEIIIVEHNPQWKLFFELEVSQISQVLDKKLIIRLDKLAARSDSVCLSSVSTSVNTNC